MTSIYNQIKKHLEVHQHVMIKSEGGKYQVMSQFKDVDGDFRCSTWEASEEEAKQNIGWGDGYEEEDYKDSWTILYPFDIPTGNFKQGDKVRAISGEDKKTYTVHSQTNTGKVILEGTPRYYHWTKIMHHFENSPLQDTSTEDLIKELETRGEIIDKKVIK